MTSILENVSEGDEVEAVVARGMTSSMTVKGVVTRVSRTRISARLVYPNGTRVTEFLRSNGREYGVKKLASLRSTGYITKLGKGTST